MKTYFDLSVDGYSFLMSPLCLVSIQQQRSKSTPHWVHFPWSNESSDHDTLENLVPTVKLDSLAKYYRQYDTVYHEEAISDQNVSTLFSR